MSKNAQVVDDWDFGGHVMDALRQKFAKLHRKRAEAWAVDEGVRRHLVTMRGTRWLVAGCSVERADVDIEAVFWL